MYAVTALPGVAAEVAGEVEALAFGGDEELAQLVLGGAEGDGFQADTIGALYCQTDMGAAHEIGEGGRTLGKTKRGSALPAPNGPMIAKSARLSPVTIAGIVMAHNATGARALDGIQAGAMGFVAPVVRWRLFLPAFAPVAVIVGAFLLVVDIFGSQIMITRSDQDRLILIFIWLSLSSFEWCWLKGLSNPRQKWWRPLLAFGPSFWIYMIVSAALLFSLCLVHPVQDYLQVHLGTAQINGDRTIYEPTLLATVLSIALAIAWVWLRIRLILWPMDIAVTGRLRSPAHIWTMTRGHILEFLGLWLVMATMAGVTGCFIALLGYAFLGESTRPFLWLLALLYMIAALDAAYLDAYMQSRKETGPLDILATA